jgi:uncharacterized protein (DUF58 family)
MSRDKINPETIDLQHIQQFGGLEFLAKQVVEGFIVGMHKSPFHGFSVEFAEHRLYNSGESTKHLDWKLYGRTDKLFVKRYEEETNLRCHLVIDASSSMYFPETGFNKLTFSVYCAAAIINMFKNQRDAVGLTVFSSEIEKEIQAKSSGLHTRLLYAELENLLRKPTVPKATNAIKSLEWIAESVHKRSLIIIFSDMLDGATDSDLNDIFQALQHLKYNKNEVILFHTLDSAQEINFGMENRPLILVDMETQKEVKLFPNEAKELYQKKFTEFKDALRIKCASYKIDYVEADIRKGFQPVLQSYLVKRSKLK